MKGCRTKLAHRAEALGEHFVPEARNPLLTVLQVVFDDGVQLEARCDDHHGMAGKADDGSEQAAHRSRVVPEGVEDCVDLCCDVPVDAVGVGEHELTRRNESPMRDVAFHVPYSTTILALGDGKRDASDWPGSRRSLRLLAVIL